MQKYIILLKFTPSKGDNFMGKLKLGVISVSEHFINKVLPPLSQSGQVEVYGVASRSEEKARAFADKWGIPKSYGSYDALLADPAVEAVYIPLPNHMHLEWIKKSADAGKHILCEKPLTLNAEETAELMAYLKGKKIKFTEAFMYRYHPKWQKARELVTFKDIGKVQAIHTIFSYNNTDPNNIRNIKAYGGGALLDIGCYAISSARFLLNKEPKRVVSLLREDDSFKTDSLTSAILDFGDARCQFTVATNIFPAQEVKVYGTGGTLTVTVPFNDFSDVRGELIVQNDVGARSVTFDPVNQYKLLFEKFAQAIREDSDVYIPIEDSYWNMKTIDAVAKSAASGQWVDLD